MRKLQAVFLFCLLLGASGCNIDRIEKLEKQNEDMKRQLGSRDLERDYDLQAKCSKDAKAWFNESYSRDKDTTLLTFTNHYNKAQNKCFIVSEYHFNNGNSWVNVMHLWDVYENSQYGSLLEDHSLNLKEGFKTTTDECEVLDKKCTSLGEWNALAQPYMNN